MVDTSVRLLRLLGLLQTQRLWTGAELASRLGVNTRTIRADIARLRRLDYQVDAVSGVAGGYRLRAGARLPPLQLDDDEAIAVAVALRTAVGAGVVGIGEDAARAATKLQQLLPPQLRHRLHTISAVAEAIPNSRDPVAPSIFRDVATTVERSEVLRFDYTDRHDRASERRVEPYRLVHCGGRWYLVGYDLDRQDWRSYRLDRISPKTPTGPRFTARDLPARDLATFVTRGRMAALWNYTARVIVDAPAETVAARIPSGIWTVEPIDPHTSALEAGAQSPQLLAAYLAAMDLDFHLEAGHAPELGAAIATLAARYTAAVHPTESPGLHRGDCSLKGLTTPPS
ncbi:helix-turn-helix transcriptional regulator [Nocardia sp. NPDC060249]|uniref:helix-turn-helix transcriptional regulator n=1 Tax=Nocardia sp. NPDC060249 TaxID=3347082 RepID=UPI00364F8C14